jgi:hypothetical protein
VQIKQNKTVLQELKRNMRQNMRKKLLYNNRGKQKQQEEYPHGRIHGLFNE